MSLGRLHNSTTHQIGLQSRKTLAVVVALVLCVGAFVLAAGEAQAEPVQPAATQQPAVAHQPEVVNNPVMLQEPTTSTLGHQPSMLTSAGAGVGTQPAADSRSTETPTAQPFSKKPSPAHSVSKLESDPQPNPTPEPTQHRGAPPPVEGASTANGLFSAQNYFAGNASTTKGTSSANSTTSSTSHSDQALKSYDLEPFYLNDSYIFKMPIDSPWGMPTETTKTAPQDLGTAQESLTPAVDTKPSSSGTSEASDSRSSVALGAERLEPVASNPAPSVGPWRPLGEPWTATRLEPLPFVVDEGSTPVADPKPQPDALKETLPILSAPAAEKPPVVSLPERLGLAPFPAPTKTAAIGWPPFATPQSTPRPAIPSPALSGTQRTLSLEHVARSVVQTLQNAASSAWAGLKGGSSSPEPSSSGDEGGGSSNEMPEPPASPSAPLGGSSYSLSSGQAGSSGGSVAPLLLYILASSLLLLQRDDRLSRISLFCPKPSSALLSPLERPG